MTFRDQDAWQQWLDANHETSEGVWMKIARTDSTLETVSHPDALEIALCYGWIDARRKSADAESWLQQFTPRGKRSLWSQVNCRKAEALVAEGKMKPAGLREIERAKADGRWQGAYSPPSTAQMPDDLQAMLDANPPAKEFFEKLDSRNRYAILHRLEIAKKPETRQRRLEAYVGMLERGEKLHN